MIAIDSAQNNNRNNALSDDLWLRLSVVTIHAGAKRRICQQLNKLPPRSCVQNTNIKVSKKWEYNIKTNVKQT
jgi:hypothetical protein